MGTLIADLEDDGLLDGTLVFCLGEFGRTVGPLNTGGGRDHFLTQSAMMAGAGIKGRPRHRQNRLRIGAKHQRLRLVRRSRDPAPEDFEATVYSALGIDWTKVYHDDPLNRGFSLVPTNQNEESSP